MKGFRLFLVVVAWTCALCALPVQSRGKAAAPSGGTPTSGGKGTNADPGTGGGTGTNGNPGTGAGTGTNGNPGTGGGTGTNADPGTGGGTGTHGDDGTGGGTGASGGNGTSPGSATNGTAGSGSGKGSGITYKGEDLSEFPPSCVALIYLETGELYSDEIADKFVNCHLDYGVLAVQHSRGCTVKCGLEARGALDSSGKVKLDELHKANVATYVNYGPELNRIDDKCLKSAGLSAAADSSKDCAKFEAYKKCQLTDLDKQCEDAVAEDPLGPE